MRVRIPFFVSCCAIVATSYLMEGAVGAMFTAAVLAGLWGLVEVEAHRWAP